MYTEDFFELNIGETGKINTKILQPFNLNIDGQETIKTQSLSYESQNEEIVILDAALLVESDYLNFIDKLLVVTCKENIQIERIIARDNCSIEEALGRIKSQMSQENKVKYADYVIDNSATLSELRKKAFIFMNYIKEKWRE